VCAAQLLHLPALLRRQQCRPKLVYAVQQAATACLLNSSTLGIAQDSGHYVGPNQQLLFAEVCKTSAKK
jgi:hypothetical protein